MFKFFNPKFKTLCSSYRDLQQSRYETGEILKKTFQEKKQFLNEITNAFGDCRYDKISVRQLQNFLDNVFNSGCQFKAKRLRMMLIDIFNEAERVALITSKFNPASITRKYKANIKRRRITLTEFRVLLTYADNHVPIWFHSALVFAFLTAQRRADIVLAHADNVYNDQLHIAQHKSRRSTKQSRIALPLDLYNAELNLTLAQFIDNNANGFIVNNDGNKISEWALSFYFCKYWREIFGKSDDQPSFHEIRSLSERYYRDQGVQTKNLLGHKKQTTTDIYNDIRSDDWLVLKLPENMKNGAQNGRKKTQHQRLY